MSGSLLFPLDDLEGASCACQRVVVGPAVEIEWLDALLAQERSDLRAVINSMVDGLNQDFDDRRVVGTSIKVEDLIQIPLFRDDRQFPARRPLSASGRRSPVT